MPSIWTADLEDDFLTRYLYFVASGPSVHDCAVIGQRFDLGDGFLWDQSESWLVRIRPSSVPGQDDVKQILLGGSAWLTRVWLSPAGRAWVSSMAGAVHEETPDGYRTHEMPVLVSGLWGLDDRTVYAWSENPERLYRFDGSRWHEMPCPGRLLVMHGVAPDDLLACGYGGQVWRWNGQGWSDIAILLRGTVVGLYAASADRAYACSTDGDVAEITPFGAQILTRWEGPLLDVTCLEGGDLLLAGGSYGLYKVPAGTNVIEPVTGDFAPERFDQRDGVVLISAGEGLVQTSDGVTFDPISSAEYLRQRRETDAPFWWQP